MYENGKKHVTYTGLKKNDAGQGQQKDQATEQKEQATEQKQ
jgi:hypothetical protein